MTTTEDPAPRSAAPQALDAEQVGYKQSLNRRHVQMIAIGGAIGTGLFLGSASRLHSTGPALLLSYAFVGVIAYFLMRALGELVLHRPTSGAFVSYMREFFGEKAAFVTGWLYWLNWGLTGIAELSAVGLYVQFWFPLMPTWATVLIALAVVLIINLLSARAFGEFEFWASILKVGAIVAFLDRRNGARARQVGRRRPRGRASRTCTATRADSGRPRAPYFWYGPILVMSGVVFAYAAIEMVGVAAGEMEDSEREVPKAVNAVIFRIGIFYCGSILLLVSHPADHRVHRRHQSVRHRVRTARNDLDECADPGDPHRCRDVQPQLRPVLHRPGAAEPGHVEAGTEVHPQDEQLGSSLGRHRDDVGGLRLRRRAQRAGARTPSRSPWRPPRSASSSPGGRSSSASCGCGNWSISG